MDIDLLHDPHKIFLATHPCLSRLRRRRYRQLLEGDLAQVDRSLWSAFRLFCWMKPLGGRAWHPAPEPRPPAPSDAEVA